MAAAKPKAAAMVPRALARKNQAGSRVATPLGSEGPTATAIATPSPTSPPPSLRLTEATVRALPDGRHPFFDTHRPTSPTAWAGGFRPVGPAAAEGEPDAKRPGP
jgi:hypothetical protein